MKKIKLTQGKYALVDDCDFDELNKFKWYALKNKKRYYAQRGFWDKEKKKVIIIQMHREIMNTPIGKVTDHINQNGLDNRRKNLRICTKSQNQWNREIQSNNKSGYIGVSWYSRYGKWKAHMTNNGKKIHIGYFDDKNEAAKAYNNAIKKVRDKYIITNKIAIADHA